MRAILPSDIRLVDETKEHLVYQRCWLQRVICSGVSECTPCEHPQLIVYQRDEPFGSRIVSSTELLENFGGVGLPHEIVRIPCYSVLRMRNLIQS